jgi:hypothetical protein
MALTAAHMSILKKLRGDCGVEDLSINPEATLKAMDARYSVSSTRVALSALRKAYPGAKKFEDEIKSRYRTYRDLDEDQEPTEAQTDNFVSWDNIIQFRDLYRGDMNGTQRLLLALYTYIPPVRADYTPMRIVNRKPSKFEEGHNYLVWNSQPYFIFHAYKTAVRYGDKYVKIPGPLKRELSAYLNDHIDNEYLFESDGLPWSATRLALGVRKIFQQFHGLDTGINLIRHAYLTKYHAGQKPLAELKKVASAMMHGPMLSQGYRFLSLE